MNTMKPLSTISYNTESFLVKKLNELVKARVISCWFYIVHQPEEDEKKQHIHLYMEPNKKVNTMDLSDEFIQRVKGEKLPRKVIDMRPSKFDDWFLYALHDPDYLASKMLVKKYRYQIEEMVTSDPDLLQIRSFEVFHESKVFQDNRFLNFLRNGGSVTDLCRSGFISPSRAFQYLSFSRLYNGDRVSAQKFDGVIVTPEISEGCE